MTVRKGKVRIKMIEGDPTYGGSVDVPFRLNGLTDGQNCFEKDFN